MEVQSVATEAYSVVAVTGGLQVGLHDRMKMGMLAGLWED